jgi:hypothetical protein
MAKEETHQRPRFPPKEPYKHCSVLLRTVKTIGSSTSHTHKPQSLLRIFIGGESEGRHKGQRITKTIALVMVLLSLNGAMHHRSSGLHIACMHA